MTTKDCQNDSRLETDRIEDEPFMGRGTGAAPFVLSSVQLYGGLIGMLLVGFFVGLLCASLFGLFE
jgi:hypothetical protein